MYLIFSTTKGELLYIMFQSLKYATITTYVKLHEINVKIDFQSSLFCWPWGVCIDVSMMELRPLAFGVAT